jgi:hypothetical protein
MRTVTLPVLLISIFLAACASGNSAEVAGTFELVTVDGNPVPYAPSHEGGAPEVLSSTLILNTDGTFQMTMTYATSPGNSITRDFSGSYTLEGDNLHFEWEGAGTTPGTLNGDTLTFTNEGVVFAYSK